MKTKIYLVRHAEAEGNVNGTFQGMTDCDVSEKGKKQLNCLTHYFKDIKLDAVCSSPLKRAMKTAEAVCGGRNIPIYAEYDLHEISGGQWEGKNWLELPTLFPLEYAAWKTHPCDFTIKDGETMKEVYLRMKNVMDKIAHQNDGKTIAVVSHGCALRNFCCCAMGLSFERLQEVPWFEHTGVGCIDYTSEGIKVEFLNDVSHLNAQNMTILHQSWWGDMQAPSLS